LLREGPAGKAGDKVEVEVSSGQARLRFSATLQADARAGQKVVIENPSSHKKFDGKLVAAGRVQVEVKSGPIAKGPTER
jgi:flagella basal body P-ring formation protein FlgA